MQRNSLGIIEVDCNTAPQLLIIYSVFVKYLKKKGGGEYNEAVHQLFIAFKRAYYPVRREVSYNILTECDITMPLVRLIKMCLIETYSRVWVGRHLPDMFCIKNCLKQGDSLSPLLLNFVLEYVIRRVHVNQGGLKLNGKQQLLVYTDVVNILGEGTHIIKINTELQ